MYHLNYIEKKMNTIYEYSKKILLKHKGEYIMIFGKKKL